MRLRLYESRHIASTLVLFRNGIMADQEMIF